MINLDGVRRLGRLMVLTAGILAAVSTVPGAVRADNPEVNINYFRPSLHPGDILGIQTTTMPRQWEWGVGAWVTYNHRPMKIFGEYDVVRNQLVMDLFAHVAFTDWLDVGVDLPLYLWSAGDEPTPPVKANFGYHKVRGTSLGDLRLSIKARILNLEEGDGSGFGLAIGEDLTFPTAMAISGANGKFEGDSNVTSTTNLIFGYTKKGWNVALNVGFRIKKGEDVVGHRVGHQLLLGAGLQAPLICGVLEAIGTIENRTSLTHPYQNEFDNGLDLMGGLRGYVGNVALVAAVGGNVLEGYGSPAVRATVSAAYSPKLDKGCMEDRDGDGIEDGYDACPDLPGIPEANGCPDGDQDGIPDADDECLDKPGHIQSRGCPDGDGDGIVDFRDKCPDKAGLIRFGGCPDDDEDGIPDDEDQCPDVPGPPANRGCPDEDRDGDGLTDD